MKKKILIVSNPGERAASNYCEGVNVDIESYFQYFTSPLGGAWNAGEIVNLNRPTIMGLRDELYALRGLDYTKIIFCGHGWYSIQDRQTALELRDGHTIGELELRQYASKRTIILDCCRKPLSGAIYDSSVSKSLMFSESKRLNSKNCRMYYENEIRNCADGIVVTYASNINETAGDSSRFGGFYSEGLRRSAYDWEAGNGVDLSTHYDRLSIVSTHEKAVTKTQLLSAGKQNPQIDKPRSDPYFPFAIMA